VVVLVNQQRQLLARPCGGTCLIPPSRLRRTPGLVSLHLNAKREVGIVADQVAVFSRAVLFEVTLERDPNLVQQQLGNLALCGCALLPTVYCHAQPASLRLRR